MIQSLRAPTAASANGLDCILPVLQLVRHEVADLMTSATSRFGHEYHDTHATNDHPQAWTFDDGGNGPPEVTMPIALLGTIVAVTMLRGSKAHFVSASR